jgi:hypothetical protein
LLETRISPFGRNDTERHFAPWRSFGSAQDMLGATNVLEIVLFTIFKVRNQTPIGFTPKTTIRRGERSEGVENPAV